MQSSRCTLRPLLAVALACALSSACADGSGSSADLTAAGPPGAGLPERALLGGRTFFPDPHQSGTASALHLAEIRWGRLVDVHAVGAGGREIAEPVYRDLVVDPLVQSDRDHTLATSRATGRTRVVLHAKPGSARFGELLQDLLDSLPSVAPRGESSPPPYTVVPRNACLVLRFDDLLDDDAQAQLDLFTTVRVVTGLPAHVPFAARVLFDANHGGVAGGAFHSTRVLVDTTVSEVELASTPVPLPVNVVGLPASALATSGPSMSVRLPTRTDAGAGQFALLANPAGATLDPAANGFVDPTSPTFDVVRAARAANAGDANNGFLLDLERPRLLGAFPVVVERALPAGRDVLVNLRFSGGCELAPRAGDALATGDARLDVVEGAPLEPQGLVRKLRVRPAAPLADPAVLLGSAVLEAPFAPDRAPSRQATACWVSFLPEASSGPGVGVATTAQVRARFTEPMDPAPASELDALLVVRGASNGGATPPTAMTTVLGETLISAGADAFTFAPVLPFAHEVGTAEPYHVRIGELRDLAGNPLAPPPPIADFWIDPLEATQRNGAIVLRFAAIDEVEPLGLPDLRGQFFFDLDRGRILPRPPAFTSWPVDRTNPVPSIMIPFVPGVSTPLNPLGSKLHSVWRYCDLGWNVRDETKFNVDVVGLAWAPRGGLVISDFFDGFEIRLAHGRLLPDEALDGNLLPRWPLSGLVGREGLFTDNILVDPLSPQKVVHARGLGYTVNPANVFVSSSGTTMMPYPLNRGPGPDVTYTWRDTAVQSKAAPNGAGIPTDVEAGPPLNLEPSPGTIAPTGGVPSFGLPLLIEYRCYPSDTGLGLNALDVSLAINSSPLPAFRAYSSGGINRDGVPVVVNPDTALVPSGSFNPLSSPPGLPTLRANENVFYIGQLDLVTRVSRVHSVWLDTQAASPSFLPPVLAPAPALQPPGTAIQLDFRGATGFSPGASAFDATRIDAYGELALGTASFLNADPSWTSTPGALAGARYLQARITFVNNITVAGQASPSLSALGLPFVLP